MKYLHSMSDEKLMKRPGDGSLRIDPSDKDEVIERCGQIFKYRVAAMFADYPEQ